MYIRFAGSKIDCDSHLPQGIFAGAYELRDAHALDHATHDYLVSLLHWFEQNLPVPKKDSIEGRAVFWFCASAQESMRNVWALVTLLQENGYFVERYVCERPGKVIYSDSYQVAAVPYRDTLKDL